jgi:hypothetical protein
VLELEAELELVTVGAELAELELEEDAELELVELVVEVVVVEVVVEVAELELKLVVVEDVELELVELVVEVVVVEVAKLELTLVVVEDVELELELEEVLTIGAAQAATEMSAISKVMLPANAKAAPFRVEAVAIVIEEDARIIPLKSVPTPKVASPPTCQKTLHGKTPPLRTTEDPELVIKVVPILMIKTEVESPMRMSEPVRMAEVGKVYTPGPRALPPRFPTKTTPARALISS